MLDPIQELKTIMETPGASAAPLADIDPKQTPLWEVDEAFLNPFADLPTVQTFATMGERAALPCQGIVTFSAKPKQGKSTATRALLCPIITGVEFDTVTPTESRPRLVIVFDTEMDTATLCERTKQMRTALGDEANRYQVVSLMETPTTERMTKVEDICNKYNPDIVILDQMAMFVQNFNDQVECAKLKDKLLTFANHRAVWTIIHQNKAADNSQMKGHLGSMLEEAAVENYGVKFDKGVFEVKPLNARRSYVDTDTVGVKFAINTEGVIITATDVIERNKENDREGWVADLRLIFGEDTELSRKEIVARIMERQGLAERAANTKVTEAANAGAIAKADLTSKRSPYHIVHNVQFTPHDDFGNI